jgi:hypothetical protein
MMPSRFNFRIKKTILGYDITYFTMLSATQSNEGISSLLPNGMHMVLTDFDNCNLEQVENSLIKVQKQYDLSDIYVVSDKEGSYRSWCFKPTTWTNLMHIQLDTDFIDKTFRYYTFTRGMSTLRTSRKKNRPEQKLVSVLPSYFMPIPPVVKQSFYDTELTPRNLSIILGDKDSMLLGDR